MITIIKYKKEDNKYIASIFLEENNSLIPYKRKILNMENYPNLLEIVRQGKTIYIDTTDCYVGEIKFEGPYGEEKIFNSEFETHNNEESELLLDLNKQIQENKKREHRLIKIGHGYR